MEDQEMIWITCRKCGDEVKMPEGGGKTCLECRAEHEAMHGGDE